MGKALKRTPFVAQGKDSGIAVASPREHGKLRISVGFRGTSGALAVGFPNPKKGALRTHSHLGPSQIGNFKGHFKGICKRDVFVGEFGHKPLLVPWNASRCSPPSVNYGSS